MKVIAWNDAFCTPKDKVHYGMLDTLTAITGFILHDIYIKVCIGKKPLSHPVNNSITNSRMYNKKLEIGLKGASYLWQKIPQFTCWMLREIILFLSFISGNWPLYFVEIVVLLFIVY